VKATAGLKTLSVSLSDCGIEDAHKEAEVILSSCLGIGRVGFYRDDPDLSKLQEERLKEVLNRRLKREPLQYIIGHVDFCGLRIVVGPGVLIPRPETELIVEEVIRCLNRASSPFSMPASLKILDLCTGSGCLALALARAFPRSEVIGTDISETALAYAGENARLNGIRNVRFLKGDLFKPLLGMRFHIIVSNPPYIRKADMGDLQPEVAAWEPRQALDGGDDGLAFYREILPQSKEHLENGGILVVELGQGQSPDVLRILEKSEIGHFSVICDYAGNERILRIGPAASCPP